MSDEKDMIEINLNEPQQQKHHHSHQRVHHKAASYLSNIRFVRCPTNIHHNHHLNNSSNNNNTSTSSNFAYGQQLNEEEHKPCDAVATSTSKSPPSAAAATAGNAGSTAAIDGTLRQLYCPDCQQRLDATSIVHHDTLFTCCLPLMPLQRLYRSALKRQVLRQQQRVPRKLYCGKCGCSLGYWEKCA